MRIKLKRVCSFFLNIVLNAVKGRIKFNGYSKIIHCLRFPETNYFGLSGGIIAAYSGAGEIFA